MHGRLCFLCIALLTQVAWTGDCRELLAQQPEAAPEMNGPTSTTICCSGIASAKGSSCAHSCMQCPFLRQLLATMAAICLRFHP
uniref:Secreted protein n=1 Tax=Oryza sativa subsp. japonica TaxID=39947 RepID=Q69MR0_ORYSJ|nr:hypothetical protein [Oryza sativa Japonica Group]BAD33855.1 hypothetical protein [Oryza sativa Japonica Group]